LLEKALNFIRDTVAAGGVILIVGTKEQAKPIVERVGKETGMPYIHRRWLGGTLTNFRMIKDNLLSPYLDLKGKIERSELGKYTKKEQLEFVKRPRTSTSGRRIRRAHQIAGSGFPLGS